jgi:hypothetical protein
MPFRFSKKGRLSKRLSAQIAKQESGALTVPVAASHWMMRASWKRG